MHSELVDVINENDQVVDVKSKDEIHHQGLLHREIHVWLFDKDKNIYFQKTAVHKSNAGLLDASIGGHVDSGENYIYAAVREIKEESGIQIKQSDLILLNKLRGQSENKEKGIKNNFLRSIYIYKNPISQKQIKEDGNEYEGLKKFSLDFLSNMDQEYEALFHKFVPTHELPLVLKYLKS